MAETIGAYEVHPIAATWPLIEGPEFDALVKDIKSNGLNHPITLSADGSTLIDGRNRLRACLKAGVDPLTDYVPEGWTDERIDAFINSENKLRRHVTPGQLAFIALAQEPIYAARAKERMRQGGKGGLGEGVADRPHLDGKARDQAAAAVGSSGRNVSKAKRVERERPDLAAQVRAGVMSLDAAETQVKSKANAPKPKIRHEVRPLPKDPPPADLAARANKSEEVARQAENITVPSVQHSRGQSYLERAVWAVDGLTGDQSVQMNRLVISMRDVLEGDNPSRAFITALDAVAELASILKRED